MHDWDDATALRISWLEAAKLPAYVQLHPGARTTNGYRCKQLLLELLANGPESKDARAAARVLRLLYDRYGNTSIREHA